MKYLILLTTLFVVAFGYNPAMMTSNTYPGAGGYQTQYQGSSQPMQYQNQQGGYQTQSSQGYRRPVYRDGMISPVNYTPYLQTRGAPMFPRNTNPQEQEMTILPYPSQYTNRNKNQGAAQNQGNSRPQPNNF